jgi:hypothetical protein
VSEFKGATRQSDVDTTKASAHLSGLDIDIIHRRSRGNKLRYCALSGSYSSTKVGAIRCQM